MIPITHVPVTSVARGIFRIGPLETGHASGPTSPYLVVGKKSAMVMEPGQDGQVSGIMEAIKKCDLDPAQVEYVWASHIHMYHVQAVPDLLKQLPRAKFLAHPRAVPHMVDTTRLMESTKPIWSIESGPADRGTKCYGPMAPGVPADRIIGVEDGQVFDLGEKEMEMIYAPGHAPHHINALDRQTRTVWPGDLPSAGAATSYNRGGHDIRPPLFHLDLYMATVKRLKALKPTLFLCLGDMGVNPWPMDTLDWVEELHTNLDRICREGMKKKESFWTIVKNVEAWQTAHGATSRGEGPGGGATSGGLFGLIAFIHQKDPSLEIPADATPKMDNRI